LWKIHRTDNCGRLVFAPEETIANPLLVDISSTSDLRLYDMIDSIRIIIPNAHTRPELNSAKVDHLRYFRCRKIRGHWSWKTEVGYGLPQVRIYIPHVLAALDYYSTPKQQISRSNMAGFIP
jgi:hypothetical protein